MPSRQKKSFYRASEHDPVCVAIETAELASLAPF
jgi:predicted extracellular nuclease